MSYELELASQAADGLPLASLDSRELVQLPRDQAQWKPDDPTYCQAIPFSCS